MKAATLLLLLVLAGCGASPVPPGAGCIDGYVWVPNPGSNVLTLLLDSNGRVQCRNVQPKATK